MVKVPHLLHRLPAIPTYKRDEQQLMSLIVIVCIIRHIVRYKAYAEIV